MAAHEHDHPAMHQRRAIARRRLLLALLLALGVLGAEIAGGILTNSLALLADAGHVVSDAGALLLALGAIWLAARPGGAHRTFGWHRAEVLAAAANGAGLLLIAGLIVWQAIERLDQPEEVEGAGALAIGAVGLVANIAAARILHGERRLSLNVRGAYLHVLGDALGSVGVMLAALVILITGWNPIDPIISIGIAVLIVIAAGRLIRDATEVLLETAPSWIDVDEVSAAIDAIPGAEGVHDLHVWTVTSGFLALSGHVEIQASASAEQVLVEAARTLRERFGIQHITLQPETAALHEALDCCDFPDQAAFFGVGIHRDREGAPFV